jgi:hypothetical protein
MEVHICRRGVVKTYLSDVRRSASGPQRSEVRKPMMERIEFREGLRGHIVILILLHFPGPFENTKKSKIVLIQLIRGVI